MNTDIRTVVVGGPHHDGALERTQGLILGERLLLMREPANPYDKNAVAVMTTDGQKLGYIPRGDAKRIASILDAELGIAAYCRSKGTTSIIIKWEI